MNIIAFEGPAGTGKTTQLMNTLVSMLQDKPLDIGQKVLALTFMHGSRRRLDEKLRGVLQKNTRFKCITFDSFAWNLCKRWKSLLRELTEDGNIEENDYDKNCENAGLLLSNPVVQSWVANSFPIILIDEAQDLNIQRLSIVKGLAEHSTLLIAADEYQCLNHNQACNPMMAWLRTVTEIQTLSTNHRTNVADLINAAVNIRNGASIKDATKFKLFEAQSEHVAAVLLANGILFNYKSNFAIISPSKGGYIDKVFNIVKSKSVGKRNAGPYNISWETKDDDEKTEIWKLVKLDEDDTVQGCISKLDTHKNIVAIRHAIDRIKYLHKVTGKTKISKTDIEKHIHRYFNLKKHLSVRKTAKLISMTVHQAKNREFDGVIILWPHRVISDAESQRRLLYNAITRAKKWCTVIVEGTGRLNAPPFG